ncbi:type II secretion system protein N [Geothermobacter ehrlichii]|uniref:Type II secretion system protein N n=1 Tax=Geothermobacter ehrlichii TaxID=213224 RepID=A0A5D3WJ82_9BACT|nr:type II secretion system protein GspN [Geothermobacter ehrlichii]TYO97555.1 type II secretion system protein N [Geothermobacter ehrlichii]
MKANTGKSRTVDPRFALLILVVVLAGFTIGFLINFPAGSLARRLGALAGEQGVAVEMSGTGRLVPLGLRAEKVLLRPARLNGLVLELDRVELRPDWKELLTGTPAIRITGELWQGKLAAAIAADGRVRLHLDDLRLQQTLPLDLPLAVRGKIAEARFDGRLPLAGDNRGQLQIVAESLELTGLKQLGAQKDRLALGRFELEAETVGGHIRIGNGRLLGTDLQADISGSLQLAPRPETGRLMLEIRFKAGPGLDPALRPILEMAGQPGRDGFRRLRLGGTFARPQIR